VLIGHVECAFTPFARMRGLLGRDGLGRDRAIHIRPGVGIHTMCMRFSIDLVFLSRDLTVVKVVRELPPFRVVSGGRRARSVVELESGWFPWDELGVGDRIDLR